MNELDIHDISVGFEKTSGGLKLSARSFTTSILDRLVGEIFKMGLLRLEHKNKLLELENERTYELEKEKSKLLELTPQAEPDLFTRARIADSSKLVRQQKNKESIAYFAYDILKIDPFFETELNPTHEIKEDWLNYFEGYAEKTSDPEVQRLWAAILSGEIKAPGSFSLATMRVLSELNQETARIFQSLVSQRIENHSIYNDKNMRRDLSEIVRLEGAGLLSYNGGALSNFFFPEADGFVRHRIGKKLFVAKPHNYNEGIIVETITITGVGQELTTLFPWDSEKAMEILCHAAMDQAFWIYVVEIRDDSAGSFVEVGSRIYTKGP